MVGAGFRAALVGLFLALSVQTLDFVEFEVPMRQKDEIALLTLTVAMEAEGEPLDGKLAVAWTIVNRSRKFGWSLSDTILKDKHFSAWNEGSPTRMRLDVISDDIMDDAEWVALRSYHNLVADPTGGATHYLNKELTKKIRGGSLPRWVAAMKETITIGRHTFYA